MTMPPSALIFDLDGTLIDSAPDIHACLNRTLQRFELSEVSLAQTRSFIGRGVAALVEQARAAVGAVNDPTQTAKMVQTLVTLYETNITHSQLYPNVTDTLRMVQTRGHAMAICTNRPGGSAQALLAHFNLTPFFSAFAFGDGPYRRKPDPAPVHHVLKQLETRTAVFIGDSETDAATAQATELPFLLFTEGYRKTAIPEIPHVASFADFGDLPDAIARVV